MMSMTNVLALILGCALSLASITSATASDKDKGDHDSKHPKAHGRLHLITLGGLATNIDVGDPGNSPGDVAVFVRPLLNKDRTEEVGTGAGRCTILRVGPAEDWLAECAITHALERGSIMVEGLVRPRVTETSVLAVV